MITHPARIIQVSEVIIYLLNVQFNSPNIIGDQMAKESTPLLPQEGLVGKKYNQLCKI